MSNIYLIRHGLTEWNEQHRMQGHSNSPLSARGLRQAQQLARRMAGTQFTALYSSDSGRARQTAQCIADLTEHPVRVDPRLRERNFGVFEGLTGVEIKERHPEEHVRWRTRDPDYVVPGGESAKAFAARAHEGLVDIAQRHVGEVIVIVTHGLVLDIVYRAAYNIALGEPRFHNLVNAGINQVRYADGRWRVDVWADDSHLEEGSTNPIL